MFQKNQEELEKSIRELTAICDARNCEIGGMRAVDVSVAIARVDLLDR